MVRRKISGASNARLRKKKKKKRKKKRKKKAATDNDYCRR